MDVYTRSVLRGNVRARGIETLKQQRTYDLLEKHRRLVRRILKLQKMTRFIVKPPVTEKDYEVWQYLKELSSVQLVSIAERKDVKGNLRGYEIYVVLD